MTRVAAIVIGALGLALADCQEWYGLEQAPADPVEKAVEDEEAAAIERAPVDDPMCDRLRAKHAEQLTQIGIVEYQLERADAEHAKADQAKIEAARLKVEELQARIVDGYQKEARTRAEMKRRGCRKIPRLPEEPSRKTK